MSLILYTTTDVQVALSSYTFTEYARFSDKMLKFSRVRQCTMNGEPAQPMAIKGQNRTQKIDEKHP
jgi:hypothetical protein